MINRKNLITKHNPVLKEIDTYSPLTVGNGNFAFSADITGLQSLYEAYDDDGLPLCTMANWGWHTTPISGELYKYEKTDINPRYYETYGRKVPYYTGKSETEKYNAIRQNPHKYNLGRIGFVFGGSEISEIHQELDLYEGILHSSYTAAGERCEVKTACHAESDCINVVAVSKLIKNGSMYTEIWFPYPSPEKNGSEWDIPYAHSSELVKIDSTSYVIKRVVDREKYFLYITSPLEIEVMETSIHVFTIKNVEPSETISLNFDFSPEEKEACREDAFSSSRLAYKKYWENGGMISLEKSTNSRAYELERRIILSQYLTAVQCSGELPPAETGLTCNSWYGKFHLEMHFWHSAHFALYNRTEMLENQLGWYKKILPEAVKLAQDQGYKGARWPKMVCYDGVDSPSPIGPLLIWQQPHVILYCEWCYKAHPDKETLAKYMDLVYETALFMESYAVYDAVGDRYVLGPPVIPVQECHKAETTINPVFELEYWIYGLETASEWLRRLGRAVPDKWGEIINKLSMPAIHNDTYMAHENCKDTFEKFNIDHPSMLGAYGLIDSRRIDRLVMENTLKRVLKEWNFERLWGWDFAVMSMTASRLGMKREAVDILLVDTVKNVYSVNGHNRQVTRKDLPLYLPGNGGLLLAMAMLVHFGLPEDDGWAVDYENINFY